METFVYNIINYLHQNFWLSVILKIPFVFIFEALKNVNWSTSSLYISEWSKKVSLELTLSDLKHMHIELNAI